MSPPLRSLVCATLVTTLMAGPGPVAAQQLSTVEFNFETLWLRFHPEGFPSAPEGSGSGTEVFAENIRLEGAVAVDLRHCIDGHPRPKCKEAPSTTVGFGTGDKDNTVEADEIEIFETAAPLAIGGFQRVKKLSELLKNNVTVDGQLGVSPKVTRFDLDDAEGDVNATTLIRADVTLEVTYANNADLDHHELLLRAVPLKGLGFTYTQIRIEALSSNAWEFLPEDTLPASSQPKVTTDGWTSNQPEFEDASNQTIKLTVEQAAEEGSAFDPSSPGFLILLGVLLLVAAGGAAYYVYTRKREKGAAKDEK